MPQTAPDLPHEGFHWQFINADGRDCTTDPVYNVTDAVEARIWCENGDLLLELTRPSTDDDWTTGPGNEIADQDTFSDLEEAVDRMTVLGWFSIEDEDGK